MIGNISKFLLKKEFIQNLLKEEVDLRCLRKRPAMQVIIGIGLVLFSYILGWPTIALVGTISIYIGEPLILIIGGPAVYGLSHLVFLLGMYLAGKEYATVFFKWFVKVVFEKIFNIPRKSSESLFNVENQR
jgi:hypothetical protein